MVRGILIILLIGSISNYLMAQDPNGNYNPFVNQGIISPSPLWPIEQGGVGEISFNIGNTGDDVLAVTPGEEIILEIVLSNGVGISSPVSQEDILKSE